MNKYTGVKIHCTNGKILAEEIPRIGVKTKRGLAEQIIRDGYVSSTNGDVWAVSPRSVSSVSFKDYERWVA